MGIVFSALLLIDGAIYNLIDYLYDIFDFLARINIFGQDDYNVIVSRIYVILGIFMLFVLAYSLLKAVINPDDFAKGESSFPNLIKNVIVSLVIIILLPTVFTVAFNIQNTILNNDTIPRLILDVESFDEVDADAGRKMAFYTFSAFFYPSASYCTDGNSESMTEQEEKECKERIKTSNVTWFIPTTWGNRDFTLAVVDEQVKNGASFTNYSQFSDEVANNQINYTPLVSTVAGVFLLYVLLNFCFDLAVRVVKLAFYQIIAPIPVICRILPGGNMKDVFSKWVKQVISIFVEVFIRIAIMYLGVFIITLIMDNFDNIQGLNQLLFSQKMIVRALLIMGVIIFIRQAPKLLGELLNLDTGGMKLGLMDKLAMGGGLIAGAAGAGLLTGGVRNLVGGVRNTATNFKSATGVRGKLGAIAGGVLGTGASTIAGAGSAMVRSGVGARGAKNFKDASAATSKGLAGAAAAKTKRAAYKASHRNVRVAGHNFDVGKIPVIGGALGVGAGHIGDAVYGVGQWAGLTGGLERLQAEQAVYQEGMGFKKDLFDLVSDDKSVMAYQGLMKAAQDRELSDYTNFYKLNANGEVYDKRNGAILKDKDGNVFKNVEAAAIFTKTQEIDKYDTAIKLASMRAIHEKLQSGDGRFTAQFEKFETYKKQHADNELVNSLIMRDIDQSQLDLINQALSTNDFNDIDTAKKTLESTIGGILYNDKQFKIKNGDVTTEIAKLVQEKKQKEGNK